VVKACVLVSALLMAGVPGLAQAQMLEIEAGGGYVVGGGAENPGPSLPVWDVGFVLWPWEKWGVAARIVDGPGEDLHEPSVSRDRTFLGSGYLRYWTVTARRRWDVRPAVGLELGFGLLFDGRFATIQLFHDPPRRSTEPDLFFNGFSLEALISPHLWKHFGLKAGVICEGNFETTMFQPVVLGTLRF
jgi:hypothetical protein